MCMYISCVGLCVHGFMNPLPSWFVCGFCVCVCVFFVVVVVVVVFFSDVLAYCIMLQAFICYCSSSDVYDVRACARVCVFFIGIVQRNWACLTWKSAIEIKSLLLLLLLLLWLLMSYAALCHVNSAMNSAIEYCLKYFVWSQSLRTWSAFFLHLPPPRWPSGKASASNAEDPGFESRLRRDFFGVESYQWLKNWHSSGYPARRLAL